MTIHCNAYVLSSTDVNSVCTYVFHVDCANHLCVAGKGSTSGGDYFNGTLLDVSNVTHSLSIKGYTPPHFRKDPFPVFPSQR